jgi:hypothetical protein
VQFETGHEVQMAAGVEPIEALTGLDRDVKIIAMAE